MLATTIGALLVAGLLWKALQWAVLDASWSAARAADCQENGACWAVLRARHGVILFGLYPADEQWRAALACATVVLGLCLALWPRMWTTRRLAAIVSIASVVFLGLMYGGFLGLPWVSTDQWGGLNLTLFLYAAGIVLGFPTSIGLALARDAERVGVARAAAVVIDAIRSLPMVMVLFTVGVLAPLLLPGIFAGDKLWRVAIAFAFVYACYQSEIVRAGMQAIPRGQGEAARALGMPRWLVLRLVVLPQALANGLPATVNLLVATFKETSIVAIIGFFDFAASGQAAFGNADWANAYVEVYLFIGAVYFGFALVVSAIGRRLEHRLRLGRV